MFTKMIEEYLANCAHGFEVTCVAGIIRVHEFHDMRRIFTTNIAGVHLCQISNAWRPLSIENVSCLVTTGVVTEFQHFCWWRGWSRRGRFAG